MDTRIGLLFLFTISPCIALECSNCMHMAIENINMQDYTDGILNGQIPGLESFRNEQCANNTAPRKTCRLATPGFIDTCTSLTFTETCMGLTAAHLSDSGMKITIVVRNCSASPEGTEDTCRNMDTVDEAETQAAIIHSFRSLTKVFDSVIFNGEHCTSSTGIFPTGTSKNNSGLSMRMLMPSVAVLLIASYLVSI